MIPKKNFLTKTVGYFSNENMAFVQTPQVYYNQDIYQYNLNKKIPNEQDFFMRDVEEARAASNAFYMLVQMLFLEKIRNGNRWISNLFNNGRYGCWYVITS